MHAPTQPDNTERFTGRAEVYDRYRQRYPAHDILDVLQQWCGLSPQWLVADIGAGTGMLSEVFLAHGNRVLAIEPNREMREACTHLRDRWPQLNVNDATAEATDLPNTSVDIVAAGRAFHWFDKQRALAEFRRILKPNGWVTLISLGRADDRTPQSEAFEHLFIAHGTDYAYVRAGYRTHENLQQFFDGEFHQTQLPGKQQLDWPAFRGQTLSLSFVPHEEHANYDVFQRELRRYFDAHAIDGILTLPTTCWITAGSFRSQ